MVALSSSRIPHLLKTKDQQKKGFSLFFPAEVAGLHFIGWLRSCVHPESIPGTGGGDPALSQG